MSYQKPTKTITDTYQMLDDDVGHIIICNKTTDFTITMQSATGRTNWWCIIQNDNTGIVTIGGKTIGQGGMAIVSNKSGAWIITVPGNSNLALGETSVTAYRGDRGKTAYDHSQTAHAPSNAQKNSDVLKSEIEAVLTGEITTHTHPGGGSGHTIQNEGVSVTDRAYLNFVGPGVEVTDTGTKSQVNIPHYEMICDNDPYNPEPVTDNSGNFIYGEVA